MMVHIFLLYIIVSFHAALHNMFVFCLSKETHFHTKNYFSIMLYSFHTLLIVTQNEVSVIGQHSYAIHTVCLFILTAECLVRNVIIIQLKLTSRIVLDGV